MQENTLFFSSFSQGNNTLNTWRNGPSSQPGNNVLSMAIIALITFKKMPFVSISKATSNFLKPIFYSYIILQKTYNIGRISEIKPYWNRQKLQEQLLHRLKYIYLKRQCTPEKVEKIYSIDELSKLVYSIQMLKIIKLGCSLFSRLMYDKRQG